MVEYWAHVQAFMPVDLWPVMQHRMDALPQPAAQVVGDHGHPELTASLLARDRRPGAATARDLDDGLPPSKEHWGWNWSATRQVLDYLYMVGDVAIAGRNSQFEIRYDLPERVIPRRCSAPDAHPGGGRS